MNPSTLSAVFPVYSMDIYSSGLHIKRKCLLQETRLLTGKRKKIKELSKRSLSRLTFTAQNTSVKFFSMITLTYPETYQQDGLKSKAELHRFLDKLQKHYGKMSYLWFLEFQKRGAPHYHIMSSYLEPNKWHRQTMGEVWAQIVSRETIDHDKVYRVHSHTRAWEKIHKPDGASRYCMKYATKLAQKSVPPEFSRVGRFWGCSRDVVPKPLVRGVDITEDELREHLWKRNHPATDFPVIPKYIWYVHDDKTSKFGF